MSDSSFFIVLYCFWKLKAVMVIQDFKVIKDVKDFKNLDDC